MRFEQDYLFGVDPKSGHRTRFTRAERGFLRMLAARPGAVVPRQTLLDAMSGEDVAVSDRNVDYVINRLRRKLGDSARAPRYIGTQYGEGYVWLGRAPSGTTAKAFLVVGPLRGLPDDPARFALAKYPCRHTCSTSANRALRRADRHERQAVGPPTPLDNGSDTSRPHQTHPSFWGLFPESAAPATPLTADIIAPARASPEPPLDRPRRRMPARTTPDPEQKKAGPSPAFLISFATNHWSYGTRIGRPALLP